MSRYNERKNLSLEEANAIGTTYLRADLLPDDDRSEVRRILYDYAGLRLEGAQEDSLEKLSQLVSSSENMQEELWIRAVAEAERNPTPVSSLFMQSLNELIDLHQKRLAVSIHHRMPVIFWIVICSMVILTMLVGGYDAGLASKRRSSITTLVVALTFSVVIMLIVVLDRPLQWLASVNQAAMIDLQEDIRRSMQLP